jgi:hypothetical protein
MLVEAEVLNEIATRTEIQWSMVQWWASITFAVLLASHLAAHVLSKLLVVIALVLYSLFSLGVSQVLAFNASIVQAALLELQSLDSESDLSLIGQAIFQGYESGFRGITLLSTLAISYLSTIFFVVYSYRTGKKED